MLGTGVLVDMQHAGNLMTLSLVRITMLDLWGLSLSKQRHNMLQEVIGYNSGRKHITRGKGGPAAESFPHGAKVSLDHHVAIQA